ncbi:MAG: DNA-directed RNA polymerase subunit omega [Holosporaceae bacterium]|jgi:DNA-directed RNA polymerase subunit omega|nr:DNA-directed RNA polymerase subunit omega [Holosporaceae bacterium]
MARITVEDCEKVVANRFDLVILAAQRTRQIISGDRITVESEDEKKTVIALREIAAQSISMDALKESSIKSFRTFTPEEDLDDDVEDLSGDDTYNPYAGIEMTSIESDNISVVSEDELKNNTENDTENDIMEMEEV